MKTSNFNFTITYLSESVFTHPAAPGLPRGHLLGLGRPVLVVTVAQGSNAAAVSSHVGVGGTDPAGAVGSSS